jgi:flagellin
VTASRGTLGAAESRLSYAISNLSSAREVLNTAESRIRDADIAQEVAELVRLQVIQQAGTAILAQANQTPATVLSLVQF